MQEPDPRLIRVGHSPDPDDAFMFYALLKGRVICRGIRFEEVVEPIEELNHRALRGELEVTALSAHAFAHCWRKYRLLSAGASVGRGYGPILVRRARGGPPENGEIKSGQVALPGRLTTAALLAKLAMPGCEFVYRRFDEIPELVKTGRAEMGVLIHEGQLTYSSLGLEKMMDLGVWWSAQTGGLPIPLGLDAIRADLDQDTAHAVNRALMDSIAYALENPREAAAYAAGFGRGIDEELNSRFIGMYVNRDTQAFPGDCMQALEELYRRALAAGIIVEIPRISILA